MTSEASTSRKPRRPWLQYSLRTMLLLMVPVACVAAWFGNKLSQDHREKEAIAWIEEHGGIVYYDYVYGWRRELMGEKELGIWRISLNYTQISDLAPLAELENLRYLRYLDIRGTQVSDLAPLAELQDLVFLDLRDTLVSDLLPLAELENLRELDLRGTRVSPERIRALQHALPECQISYE